MSEINAYKLKISQLRALVAVADYGNFSEAGLHLEVSQSAVSHAIAALEEELGVVLLSRGRQGAQLTFAGEQVIQEARQVLQLVEGIWKKAKLTRGLQGGRVRVACFRSVATHILPEAIAHFRSDFPALGVTITEHQHYIEVEEDLRKGSADIGFTYLPTSSEFEVWELFRDRYVVLLPPNSQVPDNLLTWEQLTTYPLIMTPEHRGCRRLVDSHFAQFGQTLEAAYEVKEDSTIISMVMRGLGATVIARLAAEPIPEGVMVLDLPMPLERVIGVAVLADALHSPAVFAFLDTLRGKICGRSLVLCSSL
jgi:DNA-binding transcriptional LysR family regulator